MKTLLVSVLMWGTISTPCIYGQQGHANWQQNGQQDAKDNGKGNGQGNGQSIGQGNGQGIGQGNGQGIGQGNGQGIGQGTGEDNGKGNEQGNGQQKGTENGQANGQQSGQQTSQQSSQQTSQQSSQQTGQQTGQQTSSWPNIAGDLQGSNLPSKITVIVQRKSGLQADSGLTVGKTVKDLPLLNASVVEVAPNDLATLAADPTVAYVSPDRPITASYDHYEAAVNASAAWSLNLNGNGVTVAVIDSGIQAGPDLPTPIYRQSFLGTTPGQNSDPYGHGTHVAGIIAGTGKSSRQGTHTYAGIAPGVNLVDLQVLDADGTGTDAAVIAAISTAIQLKPTLNISVINLSLGRPIQESYTQDPLCQAVEAAWNAGITVIVAAGNMGRNGYATILAPANDPYVITVGAMKPMGTDARNDDQVASYSSKGPTAINGVIKPDIVAPGNQIISVLSTNSTLASQFPSNVVQPSTYGLSGDDPAYFVLSGTSMAAPVVSAAAALLIGQQPGITPDTVKARLMKTAYKAFPFQSSVTDDGITYTSYYDAFTIGAGYLDIAAALADHEVANLPALSPSANYASPSIYMVPATSSLWDSAPAWSDTAVWGSLVLTPATGTSLMWGSSAMWGTSLMWGSSAMWGTSAVWGNSAMWGSSFAGDGNN